MAEVLITAKVAISDSSDQVKAVTNTGYTIGTGSYFSNVQYVTSSYAAVNLFGHSSVKVLSLTNTSTASISVAAHPNSQSFSVLFPGMGIPLCPSGSIAQTYYVKSTENSASMKVVLAGA